MESSPNSRAPITERDMPRELGVLRDASFKPSTAISNMRNCQNSGMG